jgi:alpha-L-arabinofuranosidase
MPRLSQLRNRRRITTVAPIVLAMALASGGLAGPINTVTIDPQQIRNPRAPLLLGMSFDARASFHHPQDPARSLGYYDGNTGAPLSIGTQWEAEWPQTSLRYPQGPINTWEWKKTVGPIAQRPIITSQGQIAAFGLQEFLDMTERNGLCPADVTIMVNVWGPGGFANPNTPLALQDAEDLVAYLNRPWDGQPFDGTNYEALRAQSHPAPYGIRYFNLGNEPWSSAEFNFQTTGDPNPANDGALRYVTLAQQFVARMRAVDSTVTFALPGPSASPNAASQAKSLAWNDSLMRHLGGRMHAISTNTYYEFEPGDMTLRGVQKVGDFLELVSARIATYNAQHGTSITHVVGEHGNALDFDYSVNPPLQLDSLDFNMCYQGAVTTADFLMMASNMPSLERFHHFIWGMTNAVWRPIKSEVIGGQTVYTIFPPAELYRELGDRVLDASLAVTTATAAGSDGAPYAVRAGAFRSNDGNRINVILVNRDPSVDQTIDVANLIGYDIASATMMTGDAPHGFTCHFDPFPFASGQTRFDVPRLAVLMLDYQRTAALGVAGDDVATGLSLARAFPNPATRTTRLRYVLPREARARLSVFDASGRRVRTLVDGVQRAGEHSIAWNIDDDSGRRMRCGLYWARLEYERAARIRRIVVLE